VVDNPNELLTVPELAKFCKVPDSTVYKWNHEGTGPRMRRVGKHCRYLVRDVLVWLDGQVCR